MRDVTVPLGKRPDVRQIAVSVHGQTPAVRYKIAAWCVHLYRYQARVRINDNWYEIFPGDATIIPPDADLEYHYKGRCEHVYAHIALGEGDSPRITVPLQQKLGTRFGPLDQSMRQAVAWFANQPERSAVRMWDILWELVGSAGIARDNDEHPAVRKAIEFIELRLGEPIRVEELSRKVGISHNHLVRLFDRAKGMTVVEYIRQRRVERARSLLVDTTRPIKEIAIEVGIPDLHLFNKTIRRELGIAPRGVRRSAGRPHG